MSSTITLADILTVENSSDVLELCCPDTGIPVWSTIRSVFIRTIMEDSFYTVSLMPARGMESVRGGGVKFEAVKALGKSFAHNRMKISQLNEEFPIVIMSTGPRLVNNDGEYFNCLSDYFISTCPDRTLAIEDLFNWVWPFPRKYNNLLMHTPLRVEGAIKGRFRSKYFKSQAKELVNLVSERASNFLGVDIDSQKKQKLEFLCSVGSASLLPRYERYKKILAKSGAKLLIKEEACYGGADNVSAMLAAKHLGIATAEYQHGAISKGHDAYNYAVTLRDSVKYKQLLPDFFLAYGVWWGEQMNAPVSIVPIGNPHRTRMIEVLPISQSERKHILVLGDGIDTEYYLNFCQNLAVSLAGRCQVVFRPHPLERSRVNAISSNTSALGVRIDTCQDIYNSFIKSRAVVSEVSTGLFEAIGLVPKIFIWDTPKARFSYPEHPFQRFSDAEELAKLVLDERAGIISVQQLECIWPSNWQQSYLDFLKKVLNDRYS